jgi:hypothetical protein
LWHGLKESGHDFVRKIPNRCPKLQERIFEAMIAAIKVIIIIELLAWLKQKKFFKKAL